MFLPKMEQFLEEVLSYIKFPYDRDDIRLELQGHILEKVNDYVEEGYDLKTAEEMSIQDMGNPQEIGVELNKQHNPFIGWIWKITNVLVVLFSIFMIYLVGATLLMSFFIGNPFNDIPKSQIAYQIDVDEKVKIDDLVIHFTKVVYRKDGELNIFYKYYDTRLWGSGWSTASIGDISDNLGNTYLGGSATRGGIISKARHSIKNFSREADTLIIAYDYYNRKYRVEIPLKSGDDNE